LQHSVLSEYNLTYKDIVPQFLGQNDAVDALKMDIFVLWRSNALTIESIFKVVATKGLAVGFTVPT
jgi:ABC-type nitrate/sulfonate/bicarbonate transport system substrate-binding protein